MGRRGHPSGVDDGAATSSMRLDLCHPGVGVAPCVLPAEYYHMLHDPRRRLNSAFWDGLKLDIYHLDIFS